MKQIFKNRIFIISIIVILFSSCGSKKHIRDYNYLSTSNFYNDSINLSAKFYADIKYPDLSRREIKKKFKRFKKLNSHDFLIYGYAPKEYEMALFYTKDSFATTDSTSLILNDSLNQQVIYRRQFQDQLVYLYLKALEDFNSHQTLIYDGGEIINSINFNQTVREQLTYWDIFNDYQYRDNILFIRKKIENAPIEKSKQSDWDKFQIMTTILSREPSYKAFVDAVKTQDKAKIEYLDKFISEAKADSLMLSVSKAEVLENIKVLAANEKLLMLNERHWLPKHRIFATHLLQPLKEVGYKYLAVEAVDILKDSILNSVGFPLHSTGYYTREPYFGIFLRTAMDLGYTVVGYDEFTTENRELSQANNILNIFEEDSNAKVFVYAGEDHILEYNPSIKRTAEYIKELSEIDPLTINQVLLATDSPDELLLFDAKTFPEDTRINNNVDYFLLNNLNTDLSEIYPKSSLKTIEILLPEFRSIQNEEVFISIYPAEEYQIYKTSAVSIKNKIWRVEGDGLSIELPIGKYYLHIWDEEDNEIVSKSLIVEGN